VLLIVREIVPGMGADEYNAAGAPVTIKAAMYLKKTIDTTNANRVDPH